MKTKFLKRVLWLIIPLLMLFTINAQADSWTKVTSEPASWAGEYLLIRETSSTAGKAWTGVDAASCQVDATISSGKISSTPSGAVTLTIAAVTGGYSIKVNGGTNNGKYIYGTSGSNVLNFNASAQVNTISYDNTNKCADIVSNTSHIRYNTNRFRYYKSATYTSSSIIQLYKKDAPACTAPNHVDISGRWDRFGGEDISLIARAYSSAGTGSEIADANITGWQWQKLVGSTWTNVSNGTVDGVTTSGATTKNLQITNCKQGNSGKYRCTVSTGATCSTSSATATDGSEGYGVKVYVLECYNGGTTVHNFARTGDTQAGTLTMNNLTCNTDYTFKVHADDYYGNNGTISSNVTNWVWSTSGGNCTIKSGYGGSVTIGIDYSTSGNSSVEGEPEISVTYNDTKTIYVVPGGYADASAKIAIYYWSDGGNGWTDFLSATTCSNGKLVATLPAWTQQFSVVRFDPAKVSTGNWDNKWNQTNDINISCSYDQYSFSSWCSGDGCKETFTAGTYSPTTYQITFAGNGNSSGSMINVTSIPCGEDRTLADNAFVKTGHTFANWKTNVAITVGGSPVAADGAVANQATINNITSDITLTAQWNVNSHTLTWNWNGGSTSSTTYTLYPATSGSVNYNAAITKPANGTMSKTGYTFSSWSSNATTMPDDNLTIAANWTAKTYDLTLDPDGGSGSNQTVTATYDATMPTTLKGGGAIVLPTKTGYTFGGYYSAKNGGGTQYYTNTGASARTWNVDDEITLYAKWTINSHTLTWNWGGGSCSGTAGTHYTTGGSLNYGTAISYPDNSYMSKAGYTFTGWSSDATTMPDDDLTITAQWIAKEDTYKTALHTGASGWTSYASGVPKSGAGYTIPAPSSVTKGVGSTCEDLHYHFAGWVADDYKGSPSGHIITATGTTDATGTTYWAVWEKEKAGSAGAAVNTLLWGETWTSATVSNGSSGQSSANPDDNCSTSKGTTIYDDASITYTQSDESNVYCRNENTGGGTAPELYIKSGRTWTISGIKTGKGASLSLTYKSNKSPTVTVSTSELGKTPSITGSAKDYTIDPDGASTIQLVFSASENSRVDDVELRVATAGVTYEDPKAVCEACVATPSISGVSLTGSSFSTTSVPVQATGASAGDNCSLASYGFYWGTSASPTGNNTASDNLSTGTFSATLTGPFVIGTTYYYRAYATNEAPNTGYSSDGTFTLQNVTFNMHSHGGDAPATQVVPQGGKATDPGDPSEVGYIFGGWYDNSSYTGSAWNFSTNTVGSGGVTLHAKWTEKPKYTITLNAGGGTISDANWTNTSGTTYTRTQSNGDESITLPTPSCGCAGWTFRGWSSTEKDNAGSFTPDKEDGASFTPASNVTYYAVYRQSAPSGDNYDKITATGDLTTGKYMFVCTSNYAMKNVISGTHMDESSWGTYTGIGSTNECDNGDYIWTIIKFGSQVVIRNGSSYIGVNSSGDITFDANPHFFTYTYNTTEERWEFTSVTYTTQQLIYNLNFKIGTTQSTDICLFKQRETLSGNYYTTPPCTAYTVTGVPNPAAGGTVTLSAATGKSGDKVYAYYTVDEDYNFTSWSASGTGASVTPTDARITELTVGSENATVTANFTAKVWRTVTWKANGVTLTGGDLGSAPVKVEDGHNITALPPTPSSCESGVGASDQFVGWVVNSENWGNKINDVSAKHIYKRASQFPTVTGDVTYHAVWAASDNTQNHWEKVTDIADVEAGFKYAVISFDDAYYVKNTDQSTAKPLVYAVTKTAGDINYTSDMEFTASDGPSGGFIFTSVAVSGVKIFGGSANDGVIVSTSSAKANASDEWFMVQDANYGAIMTTTNSKYLATYGTTDWRNYSSPNAGNRAANLHKYAYGYKQYMTLCCDKAITIASPTKTGSGTVAFTEESPVPTCIGATDIHVKITPTNGYKCTVLTFAREDGEDIVIDVDPATVIPFTAATDFVITVEQNGNTTLNTTVTFVALQDHYIDNMHYNATQNKSGNYGTAPTLSNETKGEECTGLHYKFVGWIPESDMDMDTGVPTTTANMVAGGATGKYATGTNYYAIWAEEE